MPSGSVHCPASVSARAMAGRNTDFIPWRRSTAADERRGPVTQSTWPPAGEEGRHLSSRDLPDPRGWVLTVPNGSRIPAARLLLHLG